MICLFCVTGRIETKLKTCIVRISFPFRQDLKTSLQKRINLGFDLLQERMDFIVALVITNFCNLECDIY